MEDSSIRMIYTANVYISIMNGRSYALSMTVSGLNCKIYLIIEDFEFHICGVYKPLKLTSSFLVNKITTYTLQTFIDSLRPSSTCFTDKHL